MLLYLYPLDDEETFSVVMAELRANDRVHPLDDEGTISVAT